MNSVLRVSISPHYRWAHEHMFTLVEDLSDEQVVWRPNPSAIPIAFHLWHLARWADNLQWSISKDFPRLILAANTAQQLWDVEKIATKWGLEPSHLGHDQTGMLMTDDDAAHLDLPAKDVILGYARQAFALADQTVEEMDKLILNFDQTDQELKEAVLTVNQWIMEHLIHDNRHLGMIECLKGFLTGRGTATR